MNLHLSEINSEVLESVVEAYEGGVEVVSTEDMLAGWDNLNDVNECWNPGTWWNGLEDEECFTCGECWNSEGNYCECETMQDGWKTDDANPDGCKNNDDESLDGWKKNESVPGSCDDVLKGRKSDESALGSVSKDINEQPCTESESKE